MKSIMFYKMLTEISNIGCAGFKHTIEEIKKEDTHIADRSATLSESYKTHKLDLQWIPSSQTHSRVGNIVRKYIKIEK